MSNFCFDNFLVSCEEGGQDFRGPYSPSGDVRTEEDDHDPQLGFYHDFMTFEATFVMKVHVKNSFIPNLH